MHIPAIRQNTQDRLKHFQLNIHALSDDGIERDEDRWNRCLRPEKKKKRLSHLLNFWGFKEEGRMRTHGINTPHPHQPLQRPNTKPHHPGVLRPASERDRFHQCCGIYTRYLSVKKREGKKWRREKRRREEGKGRGEGEGRTALRISLRCYTRFQDVQCFFCGLLFPEVTSHHHSQTMDKKKKTKQSAFRIHIHPTIHPSSTTIRYIPKSPEKQNKAGSDSPREHLETFASSPPRAPEARKPRMHGPIAPTTNANATDQVLVWGRLRDSA
jgi:hypothetical protein